MSEYNKIKIGGYNKYIKKGNKYTFDGPFVFIHLDSGKYPFRKAVINIENFDKIKNYTWGLVLKDRTFYVTTRVNTKSKYIHQYLVEVEKGLQIDHINHNGLDNTIENLRVVRPGQNMANTRKVSKKTSSKYKGVYWHKTGKKWMSYIQHNKKQYNLGLYLDEEEAARVYDKEARKRFGKYANTNFKG